MDNSPPPPVQPRPRPLRVLRLGRFRCAKTTAAALQAGLAQNGTLDTLELNVYREGPAAARALAAALAANRTLRRLELWDGLAGGGPGGGQG